MIKQMNGPLMVSINIITFRLDQENQPVAFVYQSYNVGLWNLFCSILF